MKNNSSAYTRARLTMFLNRITVRIQIKINLLCNSIIKVTVKINSCVFKQLFLHERISICTVDSFIYISNLYK